jgi:ribosomal protein S18 acetylase RimI-like enzyme
MSSRCLPEYRRRGIGSRLVAELLPILREMKCECAYVGTPLTNVNAIGLYEKMGFDLIFKTRYYERNLEHGPLG